MPLRSFIGAVSVFGASPGAAQCLNTERTLANVRADVETGGLISKVLLANADALCAAVSPLMDVEEDPT